MTADRAAVETQVSVMKNLLWEERDAPAPPDEDGTS